MTWLADALRRLPAGDDAAAAAVRGSRRRHPAPGRRAWPGSTRLPPGLPSGRARRRPAVRKPAALIFAADHGVAAAGVSKYPVDVTAAMLAAYRAGKSTITRVRRRRRRDVSAIDVGVGRPTRRHPRRSRRCRPSGSTKRAPPDATRWSSSMPICWCSARWGSATPPLPRRSWPRSRAATSTHGWGAERASTTRAWRASARRFAPAVERIAGIVDPLEVLREVGGAELVAIAAAIVAARLRAPSGAARRLRRDGVGVAAPRRRARRARSLSRRPLFGGARASPTVATARQAATARSGDAPRRGVRSDGGGALGGDGLCRRH